MPLRWLIITVLACVWLPARSGAAQAAAPDASSLRQTGLGGPVALQAVSGSVAAFGLSALPLSLADDASGDDERRFRREAILFPTVGVLSLASFTGGVLWTRRRLKLRHALGLASPAVARPVSLTISGGTIFLLGVYGAVLASQMHSRDGGAVLLAAAFSTLNMTIGGALATGGAFWLRNDISAANRARVLPWFTPQGVAPGASFGLMAVGRF